MGFFVRQYNSALNTLSALQIAVSEITASNADGRLDLPFSHRATLSGDGIFQVYSGLASGKTAVFVNQTSQPAQMTSPSVTALGSGGVAGLGERQRVGNGASTIALSADNAYIIFSYQIPDLVIAAPITPAKCLMLTGIRISGCNRGATGPSGILTGIWSLWVGCRNVNPATPENGATPVKLARPIDLGQSSLITTAPAGTTFSPDIVLMFNDGPIPWYPGEYFQAAITPLVTYVQQTSQEFVFTLTPIGYWK